MRRLTCILAAALLLRTPGIKGVAEDAVDAQIEAVLEVCVEELGYTATKGGFSKYGEWAGGAYKEWCSEFVS